jgi:hypothetical protein
VSSKPRGLGNDRGYRVAPFEATGNLMSGEARLVRFSLTGGAVGPYNRGLSLDLED